MGPTNPDVRSGQAPGGVCGGEGDVVLGEERDRGGVEREGEEVGGGEEEVGGGQEREGEEVGGGEEEVGGGKEKGPAGPCAGVRGVVRKDTQRSPGSRWGSRSGGAPCGLQPLARGCTSRSRSFGVITARSNGQV